MFFWAFLVPFRIAIGRSRSFIESSVSSLSGSDLSAFYGLELGLDSWTCSMSGMLFLLV